MCETVTLGVSASPLPGVFSGGSSGMVVGVVLSSEKLHPNKEIKRSKKINFRVLVIRLPDHAKKNCNSKERSFRHPLISTA